MEQQYVISIGACNLKCKYCWYETGVLNYAKTIISPETISTWLTLCQKDFKVRYLFFTGGEPMLRRDFGELLDLGEKHDIKLGLLTNATLINKSWACRLQELDVDVHVSLDSVHPEYHDSQRGNHKEVLRGLNLLKVAKVKSRSINTVITRGNIHELQDMIDFALDNGFGLNFNIAGLPLDNPNHVAHCCPVEKKTLMRALEKQGSLFGTSHKVGLMASVVRDGSPLKLNNCGFARKSLVIDSDGSIYPCFQMKERVKLGQIDTDSPTDVVNAREEFYSQYKPASCIKTDCLGVF